MNISEACSEPFSIYVKAHESLNNTVKISAISLKIAKPIVEAEGNDPTKSILKRPVEPWGFVWTNDIPSLYEEVEFSLARLAVVQAFGGFDNYLTFALAEMERWRNFNDELSVEGSVNDEQGNISLSSLSKLFSWDLDCLKCYDPLFRLFQECRHCIVHRDGIANNKLEKIAASKEMKICNENWPFSRENDLLPDWPQFKSGLPIKLLPKHSILSSAVFFAIAQKLDRMLVQSLGDNGVLYMAIFHSLLSKSHQFRLPNHSTYEAAIRLFLENRYRVSNSTPQEVDQMISRLGLQQRVREAFNSLYWQKY